MIVEVMSVQMGTEEGCLNSCLRLPRRARIGSPQGGTCPSCTGTPLCVDEGGGGGGFPRPSLVGPLSGGGGGGGGVGGGGGGGVFPRNKHPKAGRDTHWG